MTTITWKILWLITTIIAVTESQELLQQISPGAYIESWGEVAIIEKNAQIWVKLDINELWKEIERAETFKVRVRSTCTQAFQLLTDLDSIGQRTDCDSFNLISEHMIEALKIKFEKLWMESERKRRGAMDILGTGAKILFGTMDADDRTQILDKINSLSDDNLNNIKFNFEYAKIIEKTVANINTTIEICNRNGKLLNLLNNKMSEIIYQTEVNERSIRFFHFIKDLQQIFYLMNTETSERISELHQTLIDLHNNVFNTRLYGYKDIVESLRNFNVVDKNIELAISLSNPNFSLLRHLMKYCLVKKGNVFYIIYSLPLINIEKLALHKLYPIPEITDGMASYLDFNSEFLMTNNHFDKFQLWSMSQLKDNCDENEGTYYCKNLQLLRNDKESCEVKLMTENYKNLKNICKTKISMLKEHVLIKTKNDNAYISLTSQVETGTLVTGKKVKNLKFSGAQLLTVNSDALLSLETMQIKFYNNSNIVVERKINLTSSFQFTLRDPIWKNISLPTFETPQIIDNKQFSDNGIELKSLEDKARKIIDSHNKTTKNDWIIYFIIAIATSLLVVGVAIALIMLRKSNQNSTENGTLDGNMELPNRETATSSLRPGDSESLP